MRCMSAGSAFWPHRPQRHGPVHGAGIDISEAETVGETAGDGALAGAGRSVDGDDYAARMVSHYFLSETTCMTLRLSPLSEICSMTCRCSLVAVRMVSCVGGHGVFSLPAAAVEPLLVIGDEGIEGIGCFDHEGVGVLVGSRLRHHDFGRR